jgi:dipeptidyl aminopeptidase/acylaminoacyl peptidase
MTRARGFLVVVIAVTMLFIGLVYALRNKSAPGANASDSTPVAASSEALRNVTSRPHLFFRNTRLDDSYGRLVAVALDDVTGPRLTTDLACDRLDVAAGVGVCLTADRGVLTTYMAVVFNDRDFAPGLTVPLDGIPSRVRMSPNGALAGITVFVSGHAYSQDAFSTKTILLDTRTGEIRAELESLVLTRHGQPFKNADFNYWGVTFARDSNTFYVTVSSGGIFYLVRADATTRRGEVIGEGVECPALSPDNRRVAFKKRQTTNGRLVWRLALLDLASGRQDLVGGETRSVDDQVEWLDDHRILYSTPSPDRPGSMIVSAASVDEGTTAQLLTDAYSPSVP